MTAVGDAAYPTPSQILQTILNAIVFGYVVQGLSPPNVLPGSDHYQRAQAYADQVAVAIANGQISAAAFNPLTATGTDLIQLAAVFGVQPRPASQAVGYVTIAVSTGTVNIPAGFPGQINGQAYQTFAAPGSPLQGIGNGAQVAVQALAAGSIGNQAANAQLTWSSAAIGTLGPLATVTSTAITNGYDTDTDDTLRARLLQKLSSPPVGGNASSVQQWVENASAAIQAGYVYACARGAAAYDVAVTSAGGQRTVASAILTVVKAAVLGLMPGQNDFNLTTVTPQLVDVVLQAQLPLPQAAGGSGGGWRDAAPWPAEVCKITAYNAGTGIATVNSVVSPSVGSSIGVWDPTYIDPVLGIAVGTMREYSITGAIGGSAGAWTFTVQSGWIASPLGQYVSAGALSLVSYATTFLAGIAAVGPGEKTAFLELLPLAARFPAVDSGTAPPGLTTRLSDLVQNAYAEIANLVFAATYSAGTTTTQIQPNVPATTADPPGILVLNSLAFIKG
jgi:uncharacterized phage protein gp47/JayE